MKRQGIWSAVETKLHAAEKERDELRAELASSAQAVLRATADRDIARAQLEAARGLLLRWNGRLGRLGGKDYDETVAFLAQPADSAPVEPSREAVVSCARCGDWHSASATCKPNPGSRDVLAKLEARLVICEEMDTELDRRVKALEADGKRDRYTHQQAIEAGAREHDELAAKVAALEEWSRQSYLRDHRLAEPVDWKGCHLCNCVAVGTCNGCEKRVCMNHLGHCDSCKSAQPAPVAVPACDHGPALRACEIGPDGVGRFRVPTKPKPGAAPDKNCFTPPDGSCTGTDCMHTARSTGPRMHPFEPTQLVPFALHSPCAHCGHFMEHPLHTKPETAAPGPHIFSGASWGHCDVMLGPKGQQIKCDRPIDHGIHNIHAPKGEGAG